MATNIQKEAQELFGNPTTTEGLVTFSPEQYSKQIELPGTDDIAGPNPLAAIATAGTRTYSPPTRSISTGFEQEVNFGESAFLSDINITAPNLDDLETIKDVPGFENVSKEAIKSLGLVGMTPTSLTRTANNLMNLNSENIINNAFNITTKNTPVAGALGIADKALSGAFNQAFSLANPKQAAELIMLANNLSSISINSLQDIPGQIGSNIENFFQGLGDFIANPLDTLEAFVEIAGEYLDTGTVNAERKSFTVNGIEENYITNQKGEVVTTPGFVKAAIGMSPLSSVAQAANILVGLVADETAAEKAARQMANLEVAAELPSLKGTVNVPSIATNVNFGITSVPTNLANIGTLSEIPFTDILSISEADIVGLPIDINIDMAEFNRTGTVDGAIIGNSVSLIGEPELEETLNAAVNAAQNSQVTSSSRELADAIGTLGHLEGVLDAVSGKEQGRTGVEIVYEAMLAGEITNEKSLVDFVDAALASKGSSQRLSTPGTNIDPVGIKEAMSSLRRGLVPYMQKTGHMYEVTDPLSEQRKQEKVYERIGENLGASYNSQNPSDKAIEMAQVVMDKLGTFTYQPNSKAVHAEATKQVLHLMNIHNVNATRALEIEEQAERTAEEAAADVASTASAVAEFQSMSIQDMADMSAAEAAEMDAAMGFGEDSDW